MLRVTAEGGIIYKIYKISRCRRRAGESWICGTRYKSKLLALRAEINKSYRLCASRNRLRRNNLQDLQGFATPEASRSIMDLRNSYKSKLLALRAEIYKSYRLCASRNRLRRNNLQDFTMPKASRRIRNPASAPASAAMQKDINVNSR